MTNPILAVFAASFVLSAAPNAFDYDKSKPLDLQLTKSETRDGVEVRDVTFASAGEGRTPAYLVVPAPDATVTSHPVILFVHWYEPESADSNRTQFLDEAVRLARLGAISLLPATMWSEPKWFPSRARAEDVERSTSQVKELRRALDVLLAQPGADSSRVGYVGHDFGAMFGAILASADRRPTAYALQAGTSTFSHWYLYGPKMPDGEREAFVEKLKAIDPVTHIGYAAPAPVLFQFGKKDPHVPDLRANQFIDAAREPKKVLWYDAGHKLDDQAKKDRVDWLIEKLKL